MESGNSPPHKEANPHSHLRFRDPGFSPRDHALAADVYDSMMRKGSFQFQEAMQDSMLSLKKLMQAIKGGKTYIEDIPGFENPYLAENRMSSQNNAEQHEYFRQYMTPLLQEVGKLCGSDAVQRRALSDYMMAKHGLERNEVLARRDAEQAMIGSNEENDLREATKALAADPADAALQKDLADAQQLFDEALDKKYQANRKRDYSGLTALTGIPANVHAEAKAQEMVDRYEAAHDTSPPLGRHTGCHRRNPPQAIHLRNPERGDIQLHPRHVPLLHPPPRMGRKDKRRGLRLCDRCRWSPPWQRVPPRRGTPLKG